MFLHSFQYNLRYLFRQRQTFFWNLLFPLVLSTLFYIAFSGMAESEIFHAIPVAVVLEDSGTSAFQETIDSLSWPEEEQFLSTVYTTEPEALALLENKEIIGILYEGTPVTLTVSAEMSTMKLEQSILDSFVERYNIQYSALEQIAVTHPEKLSDAARVLAAETTYNTDTSFSDGDMDEMITYFFNLIAMNCLFATLCGIQVALCSQANLSSLGIRKCISPLPKSVSCLSALCAALLYQFLCVSAGLFYITAILGVNFGNELEYVFLTIFLGIMAGTSFGFFLGCISRFSENVKIGIAMAATMLCCFLSGLMMGNIRIYVEKICPWFNHINPAALISDSFYALTVYRSHERYWENSTMLLLFSVVFYLCGFVIVRRKKYAAI